jgi:hypothetical protein
MNEKGFTTQQENTIKLAQQSINNTSSQMISSIEIINTFIKDYKSVLNDYFATKVEYLNILRKYSSNESEDLGSTYSLPSIVGNSLPNYDINQLKKDNEEVQELKEIIDELKNQYTTCFETLKSNLQKVVVNFQENEKQTLALENFLQSLTPQI